MFIWWFVAIFIFFVFFFVLVMVIILGRTPYFETRRGTDHPLRGLLDFFDCILLRISGFGFDPFCLHFVGGSG